MWQAKYEKYVWTQHSKIKMRQYRLTESRIKRIIRHPLRTEEGVLNNAVACMQPAGGKNYAEIWTMVIPKDRQIRVITAWRYPAKSPARNPIPQEILAEIKNII